jgi:hypothetical protein
MKHMLAIACLVGAVSAAADAPTARRFEFSSVGTHVKLEKRGEKIAMRTGPSDAIPARREPLNGSWWELQDAAGKTLYRKTVHDMLGRTQEVPDKVHPTNVRKDPPTNTFELLVPETPGAKDVVLFASTDDQSLAKEIARFAVE